MMHSRWNALLLFVMLPLVGCKETPSAAGVKWEIERQFPGVRLERESHIRLGRLTMALAKKVARLAADKDDADDLKIISHIKRVDVATYRVVHRPEGTLDVPTEFEARLARKGWETMIRQQEDDEQTWVLYREGPNGAIRNLYIVALDPYELTVVDLAGRLDRLIAEALADDPGEISEIFGP